MLSVIRSYLPEKINTCVWYYVGKIIYSTQHMIDTEFTASQITDQLYIGNLSSVMNLDSMKANQFTHVLSIMNGGYAVYPEHFTYKVIHINDDPWVAIEKYFEESIQFIGSCLEKKENKLIVHCHQGVSRSVSIVVAYLLWKKNNVEKILQNDVADEVQHMIQFVHSKRNVANPNIGFVNALENYIARINNYPLNNTYNCADNT